MADGASSLLDERRRRALASYVAERFGLALDAYSSELVRLLLRDLPVDICSDDATLASRVIAACGVGETTFLRHPEHFDALRALLPRPDPSSSKARPLRVWSAGCATGEEAYSLAATLWGWPGGVQIIASDVNEEAVARGREGRYRLWSLRGVDPERPLDWLEADALGATVVRWLRPFVEFRALNLVDGDFPTELDAIFCRNVLLYFTKDAAQRVLARMSRHVRPGGLLFIGYADPEPQADSGWRAERLGGVRYFRRATSAEGEAEAPRPPAPPVGARDDGRGDLEATLTVARGLAGQRRFDEALALLDELVRQEPLHVVPHVLAAMIADDAGRAEEALASARRACFLAPDEPVPLYLLAACLHAAGEAGLARRRLERALDLLAQVPANAELPHGEGLTAGQLRRMIEVRLG